jgi:ATP:cob(I)alamin adenosyltransferase
VKKSFSITTKKGDDGTTSLLDNSRVKKDDLRPEAYGTLDEAAAFLGLARAKTKLEASRAFLLTVQNHLYVINSELACPPERLHLLKQKLSPAHLQKLEELSQTIEAELELPRKFILYGQSEISAILDVARAVVRRAERRVVELQAREPLEDVVIPAYLNRLSDALFLLARYEEFKQHLPFAHLDGAV